MLRSEEALVRQLWTTTITRREYSEGSREGILNREQFKQTIIDGGENALRASGGSGSKNEADVALLLKTSRGVSSKSCHGVHEKQSMEGALQASARTLSRPL